MEGIVDLHIAGFDAAAPQLDQSRFKRFTFAGEHCRTWRVDRCDVQLVAVACGNSFCFCLRDGHSRHPPSPGRGLHDQAALHHDARCFLQRQDAGAMQRCNFADAVSGQGGGSDTQLAHNAKKLVWIANSAG